MIAIYTAGNRTVVTNSCDPNLITKHNGHIRTCNITYATKVFRALYRDFFYYHIASILIKDEKSPIDKQEAVAEYIHQNVFGRVNQSIYPEIDHPANDVLLRGVGWCDQVADLFIRLVEWDGMQAFDIFLSDFKDGKRISPHTVAIVVPDGIENNEYRSMMGTGGFSRTTDDNQNLEGRKVGGIVDVTQGVVFKNQNNKPATLDDLCTNNILASQKKYLSLSHSNPQIYCNNPTVWLANTPLSLLPTGPRDLYKSMLSVFPKKMLPLIHDLFLSMEWHFKLGVIGEMSYAKDYPEGFNKNSFIYLKARIYHVTERFDDAILLYDEVIDKTTDSNIRIACNLFKGMIFFRQKELDKAREQLTKVNFDESPWKEVAINWLEKISAPKEA